jgi:predicted 3-demethylubiquinone-9 3-methyltransferase (glyoxalase superfamily)/catechol 2,3-dioxygenase-like lactoylglutathione lyase family enzyme
MARSAKTLLMFEGVAEQAMNLYVSLFSGSTIARVEKYGPGEAGAGTIKRADFTVAGYDLVCIDSPVKHGFTFTAATSIFVETDSESELAHAFEQLSADGQVFMPLGEYGFSRRFGWVSDRFGVSWQLNLGSRPIDTQAAADVELFSSVPVFLVDDVNRTAEWYRDHLGFRTGGIFPPTPPAGWASLVRDGAELMLQRLTGYEKPELYRRRSGGVWDAYLRMRGVRLLFERVAGEPFVIMPLTEQPYGDWEFEVRDPNGYVLVFSEG